MVGEAFNCLYGGDASRIGHIRTDGLEGLNDVVCEVFPDTSLQICPHTHLKRNILSDVCNGDRVADDLRPILRRKDRNYTVKQAWDE